MDADTLVSLALSVGLGLLVGLQRESTGPHVAGMRTMTLITLAGGVFGVLVPALGSWIAVAGMFAVIALLVAGYVVRTEEGQHGTGLTTSTAAIVMYGVGLALGLGQTTLGVLVGASVALLLQWKEPLHALVGKMGSHNIRAVMRLVLLGLVILPILPDRSYGPYGVLNPFEIWLVVVLVSGVSLGAYVASRLVSSRVGVLVGGVFGGLVSSTATTVSHARLGRRSPAVARSSAAVVTIASTVVFARVFAEVAVISPSVLVQIAPQLGGMTALMVLVSLLHWWLVRGVSHDVEPPEDPLELRAALVFALLYGVVLFGVAFAKEHLDDRALYLVAGISGLTDVDAITLSTARLVDAGKVDVDTGWRMILVGILANLVFKAFAVGLLGHRRTLWPVCVTFGVALLGGAAMLAFWPAAAA